MIVPAHSGPAREFLVGWLANRLGTEPERLANESPFEILGVARSDGALMGAVLYNNYRHPVIEMSCAGEPGWLTKEALGELFAYPFHQLGCWTVLTRVERKKTRVRAFNRKLGFRELCAIPLGPQKSSDVILYCMTQPECRWLPRREMH